MKVDRKEMNLLLLLEEEECRCRIGPLSGLRAVLAFGLRAVGYYSDKMRTKFRTARKLSETDDARKRIPVVSKVHSNFWERPVEDLDLCNLWSHEKPTKSRERPS